MHSSLQQSHVKGGVRGSVQKKENNKKEMSHMREDVHTGKSDGSINRMGPDINRTGLDHIRKGM